MANKAENPFQKGDRVFYYRKTGNMQEPDIIPATVVRPTTENKTSIVFDKPKYFGRSERVGCLAQNKMLRREE